MHSLSRTSPHFVRLGSGWIIFRGKKEGTFNCFASLEAEEEKLTIKDPRGFCFVRSKLSLHGVVRSARFICVLCC